MKILLVGRMPVISRSGEPWRGCSVKTLRLQKLLKHPTPCNKPSNTSPESCRAALSSADTKVDTRVCLRADRNRGRKRVTGITRI